MGLNNFSAEITKCVGVIHMKYVWCDCTEPSLRTYLYGERGV